jgi:hypothetical protein
MQKETDMARKIVRPIRDDRTVTIRNVTVLAGTVAKVAVQIDNSDGVKGCDMFIEYDQTILTKPRLIVGTALVKQAWHLISDAANPGEFNCCLFNDDVHTALPSGITTLAELHFNLMPNAAVGDVAFVKFSHVRLKGLVAIGVDGSVTVV